jgi:hypothetical protein
MSELASDTPVLRRYPPVIPLVISPRENVRDHIAAKVQRLVDV